MYFHQNPTLFHGPGGSAHAWISMSNQANGDLAVRSGVPVSTVLLVQEITTIRKLNWQAISQKALSHIMVPRLVAIGDSVITARWAYMYYLSITMNDYAIHYGTKGIKGKAAAQGVQRALANTRAVGYSPMISPATQAGGRRAIRRRFALRAGAKVGLRIVPVVGYALLAYDIYTITTRGELWGVKIYEEEQYVHHYQYPVL